MRAMRKIHILRLRRVAGKHVSYTSVVTDAKTGMRCGRKRRVMGNTVITFLVFVIAMLAGVGTANASMKTNIIDDLGLTMCKAISGEGVAISSLRANAAMGGTGYLISASTTDDSKAISMTPYEKYGSAGGVLTSVSLDEKKCSIANGNYTMVANFIFTGTKGILTFATLVYSQASNSAAYQATETAVLQLVTGDGTRPGLRDLFFFNFINIAIMIGTVYCGWVGLVKKASIQAAQAFGWMFGALLVSSLFTFAPQLVTQFATGAVSAATHAIAGAGESVGTGFYTYVCPTPDDNAKGKTISADADSGDRTMMCKMWEVLVLEPYMQMQFGGEDNPQVANQSTSVEVGNNTISGSLALKQIDNTTAGPFSAEETVAAKQAAFDEEVKNIRADDAVKATWGSDWQGDNGSSRIWIALMSLVGMLFAGGFIIWISLKIVMAEFETLLYVLVAPIVLMFGVMPQSKGIAIGWAEGLANNIMKRIMYSLQIGLLILLYSILYKVSDNYAVTILIVAIMSVVFFTFSTTMINMVKIRFNGAAAFAGGNGASVAGRIGAAGIGGVTGAATGLLAGGFKGAATGAIKATTRAATSNSTGVGGGVRAGMSAGRSVRAQTNQARVVKRNESSHRAQQTAAHNLHKENMEKDPQYRDAHENRVAHQNESMERSDEAKKEAAATQRVTDYNTAFEREERNATDGKESEWSKRFTKKNGFAPPRPETLPKNVSGYDFKPEAGTVRNTSGATPKTDAPTAQPTKEFPKDTTPVKDNSRAGVAKAKAARESAAHEARNFPSGVKSPANPDVKATRSFPTSPMGRPTAPTKPGQK